MKTASLTEQSLRDRSADDLGALYSAWQRALAHLDAACARSSAVEEAHEPTEVIEAADNDRSYASGVVQALMLRMATLPARTSSEKCIKAKLVNWWLDTGEITRGDEGDVLLRSLLCDLIRDAGN